MGAYASVIGASMTGMLVTFVQHIEQGWRQTLAQTRVNGLGGGRGHGVSFPHRARLFRCL